MSTPVMTAAGGWKVELMQTWDGTWFRVRQNGHLVGLPGHDTKHLGMFRTIDEVAAVMGDAFTRLS